MSEPSLQGALQALKSEKASLAKKAADVDRAIAAIEGIVGGKARRVGRPAGRPAGRPGRPPGKAAKASKPKPGRTRKNAPKGLLKKLMHEVLKGQKAPMAPVALRNAIMKAGYPTKNPQTLYTAIFNAAKKDSAVRKTADGFSMK